MKINSDIQRIIDSKTRDCAVDAEAAAAAEDLYNSYARDAEAAATQYAGDALNAWDARHALIAWSHYENQF